MASFNKVVLLGNLTRDIELKYTQGGTAVCDIGLAVNEREKRGNEWVESTVFVDCTAFGRTAEVASEYASKGSPILIEGRLKLDQWEQDGQRRSKLKVVVDRLQLLGSRSDQGGERETRGPSGTQQRQAREHAAATGDSDVPF